MYQLIVFLPLLGFLITGLFGRSIGVRASQLITSGFLVVSALLSITAFINVAFGDFSGTIVVANWINSGALDIDWAFKIDTLTTIMLVVVTVISSLVHIYSIGYMSQDDHNPRFFAYLSFFTFAMLMLVTSNNFLQMFFGWEGVGVASYLLIGFWYKKPTANAAAIKAFLVNRVGDFGFSLGILAIFLVFGTLEFEAVFNAVPEQVGKDFEFLGYQVDIITTICILLFIGAMGKSAQLGLHTWLPDAMEGPTPVSALIHAATMVTAGVFLVARCSPIFEYSETALNVVAVVGASTAFFAATIGLVQNDIKRVIAYSTCSQLGYMFFALGVSAYGAAIFHLFTHAFFKALLFLGSGSVIHAMSDEQDMRKMGGLYKMIPITYIMMVIGTLALTGFPGLSGYFSKDMIIESAYASHSGVGEYAFVMGVAAVFMTSFYSWRLIFMTFHGKTRANEETLSKIHESPKSMTIPLLILAIGAVGAGAIFSTYFIGEARDDFWKGTLFVMGDDVIDAAHHVPAMVKYLPLIMMLTGFYLAYVFYIKKAHLPKKMAEAFSGAYKFLLNKWYFDEFYDLLFVRPAFWIGRVFWKKGDGAIIDGLGVDGISTFVFKTAKKVRTIQTGYLYHYAFAMLIGVVIIVTYVVFFTGGTQ